MPRPRGALCLHRDDTHDDRSRHREHDHHAGPDEIQLVHLRTTSLAPRAPRCTWFVAIALLAWSAGIAEAAEPERYNVSARVDRDAGALAIEERVTVRVAEGEHEVRLWVYADRLSVAPRALGERTWRWLYPGDVEHGEVAIDRVSIDGAEIEPRWDREEGGDRGRDARGGDLVIPITSGAARTIEIVIAMRLRVPARFGRLGRDGGTVALAGPWYPLVVGEDDGWRFVVPHRVSIEMDDGELWLGGQVARGRTSVEREVPYVPALLASRLHRWTARIAGVDVAWTSFEPIYVAPRSEVPGAAGLADLVHVDRIGLMRQALEPAIATARWLRIALPARIDLLDVPTRTELAATAPGVVIVSDRFAQVFPVDVVQAFHLRALRRAVLALLAQPIADAIDPIADRGWTEDLRGAVLLELDEVRRSSEARTPQQLLSAFAFHPAIDQLLYAPQIAFEDVYFSAIDEPDPYRDEPSRARVPHARGMRLLESARDVLEPRAFERFVAMIANGRRSVRAALERVDPAALLRLPTWLDTPRLETNYRLGAMRSERLPDGRWRHVIEVLREGATRVEPVQVEVEDATGARTIGVWDAPGERGEVVIETEGERRSVTIDPRQRLPQSAAIADGHPRADDATDQPWRPPVFTGFAFEILATEANVTGLIDVVLRQRYDLEHTFNLRLLRTAARTGGRIRYLQGVGPKVHTNRRSVTVGGGIGFYNVHAGFGGPDVPGGWAADADLSLYLDTRSYLYDWREGLSVLVQGQATATFLDDGTFGATGRVSARFSGTIGIGNLHAIVLVGHAGVSINPVVDANRQSIGGRYGLRGYATDELLGTSVVYGVAEHRFTAVTDLAWNVFHGIWARELQLAWWLGAGMVLGTSDGRDVVGAAEAGVGVRVHYEYAGIQPGVLALDFGVPFGRWIQGDPPCAFANGECDDRPPFGFYISVDQYY
ncbi:Hypothetical protein I5071_29130 [Sandaracinus amylolyticus]|nr:Hypothetical protein I5071_29130 [Sandaracinus amylolyticus]